MGYGHFRAFRKALRERASPDRKKSNEWFFKTGKGQYGHGDVFIGVAVPDIRKVVRRFCALPLADVKKLLQSKIHEERLAALLLLVRGFESGGAGGKKRIYDFYMKHFRNVNNWDLVDASAHKIAGRYALRHPGAKRVLCAFAKSKNLWERRLSIVATFAFIQKGSFGMTIRNAEALLADKHDLTHKAVGWMLREVWKRDHKIVEDFLVKNYARIPRTTLRYAIERMDGKKRKLFLSGANLRERKKW